MTGERPALLPAIAAGRVVPVARGLALDRLHRLAAALRAAGVGVLEVTMDSPQAAEAIAELAASGLAVGAGTVLSVGQAADALAAGAQFLVSPHTDPDLVRWSAARDAPFVPGAFTPTEVLSGWAAGAAAVKLFPAAAAGPALVRELRGPLPHVPLIPSGGISDRNAGDFLAAGAVAVAIGGWLTGAGPDLLPERAEWVARLSGQPAGSGD